MNKTEELLLFLSQNARMGIENLTTTLTLVKPGTSLAQVLEGQRKGYVNLHQEARALLEARHIEEVEPPLAPKMWSFISLHLHTVADKSEEKLAQLLVEGSTMGIIDIQHHLNDCGDADSDAVALAQRLLTFQEGAVDKFKEYL